MRRGQDARTTIILRFRVIQSSCTSTYYKAGEQANTPLLNRSEGLQVPNQTLALVGGKVTIEGGILTTEQGRIELRSVAGNGSVSLTPINKGFSYGVAFKNF